MSLQPTPYPAFPAEADLPAAFLAGESYARTLADVDAHDVLAEAVHRLRAKAAAKGVQVTLQLVARGCTVRANPERLGHVFKSLLRSALDATPPGGRITIRSTRSSDCSLRIEVAERSLAIRKWCAGGGTDAPTGQHLC